MAPTYRFCGLAFASDVPPPGIAPSRGEPRYAFRCLSRDALAPIARWSRVWRLPDGRVSLCVANEEAGHRLLFPGLAEFAVAPDRREIVGCPIDGTSRAALGRLLVAHVLPRLLGLEGRLVLHGGVVRAPEGAVALLGDSGAGKSTLCSAIVRVGLPLLTDDCFAVDVTGRRIVAVPGCPELRLLPDAHRGERAGRIIDGDGKLTVTPGGRFAFASAPTPLARIYVLAPPGDDPGAGVEISSLASGQAFTALIRNSFQLDIGDRDRASVLLDAVSRVVERVPVRTLRFRRRRSLLPAVREAILADRPQRGGSCGGRRVGVGRP